MRIYCILSEIIKDTMPLLTYSQPKFVIPQPNKSTNFKVNTITIIIFHNIIEIKKNP